MKKKVNVKVIAIVLVILMILAVICIFGYIVYKNIFAGVKSKRLDGVETHQLAKDEISEVKSVFNELEQLESIDVDINKNSKIIKIKIVLKEDVDFNVMKELCNTSITKITEENLEFYDVEVFIGIKSESEIYPQIGYKHRSKTVLSW